VLQAWLDEKMFQEVRTKDQLGYKVQVNFVENAGIYGISFLI
jgi:secreted Zn-dependent insulinase-like peptidase